MPSDESPASIRRHELIREIGQGIVGRAPAGWTRIDAVYMAAGDWLHRRIDIRTEAGPYDGSPGRIDAGPVRELRDVMSAPGAGTWFTMYLTIERGTDVDARFDRDGRPPIDVPIGSALAVDLERYPRSVVPQWMRDDIAEAERRRSEGARHAAALGVPAPEVVAAVLERIAGGARRVVDADVDSMVDEMRYIRIERNGAPVEGPVVAFCEIDEDGYENRKVEVFPDGVLDYAGGFVEGETTRLGDDPVGTVAEISRRPGFTAHEITSAEFRAAWAAAGGFED
ncbi:DUF6881 domain-containing protein [Actinomadura sp. WAC 06369]|uniref:DUF6881 domain-containing protein n=1 Tax=Actinomadura sp. WAC 06369 TaxID=2203193 RepID=UPI000F7B925C|nr:hypothetical protein [Actinomadura sp. WAC 06369]RSN51861.1 hypothetical protein DMH08_29765 [Actinomadura sp. WAC 06369]